MTDNNPKNNLLIGKIIALLLVTILYILGFKLLYTPAVLILLATTLPFPRIFQSFLSRLVASFLISFSFLQIAATIQFIALPKSGFHAIVIIASGIVFLALLSTSVKITKQVTAHRNIWVDRKDIAAICTALFFVTPFLLLMVGSKSITNLAEIGGIQAIDATNHSAITTEMRQAEHLTYKVGDYYPKGFHIASGFTLDTLSLNQAKSSWTANVRVFIFEYLFFGTLLAYMLFYLCRLVLDILQKQKDKQLNALMALSLGPALSLFYLIPFTYNGFLNYFYIIAVISCAIIFIQAFYEMSVAAMSEKTADKKKYIQLGAKFFMVTYLALIYGVSMSWPLLIPPLLLIPVFYAIPEKFGLAESVKRNLSLSNLLVALGFLIQLIPIYFQLKYSGQTNAQGINLLGGIRIFHFGVLIAGFGLISYILISNKYDLHIKKFINSVFVPCYILLLGIVALQFFTVGELRYYAIKSGYLIEILTLAMAVAWLIYEFSDTKLNKLEYYLTIPLIPLVAMMLLVGINDNPISSTRDLFRTYSHEPKPTYFDQDVKLFTQLGESGRIKHFNVTLLHYDPIQGKLIAHMQLPFWSDMMSYSATEKDHKALFCSGALYANLNFGTFSPEEQAELPTLVKKCADMAKAQGQTYYIVTDKASASRIKATFGDVAVVIQ